MTAAALPRPRRRTGWVLPLLLVLLVFLIPPVVGGKTVPTGSISEVIQRVLFAPNIESVSWVLPVAKLLLLAVAVLGVAGVRWFAPVVQGYYAVALIVIALLQNSATLPGQGLAVLAGNLGAQLVVAAVCVAGLRRTSSDAPLYRGRLWLLPFMAWAWAYPFVLVDGAAVAGGWARILQNGAGVTYCMVTPVVAGVMALRPSGFGRQVRGVVGWLGVVFGLLNMVTWFVTSPASWWMGVLHVPLLVVSTALVWTTWRERV